MGICKILYICKSILSYVVGYQNYPLEQGYNLYSPVFEAVGESMSIQNLKVVGEYVSGSGANNICFLNASGVATGTYGWWTPDDGTGEDEGCWFDGDNWAVIDDTVTTGQGFYIYAEDANISIQCSGQVRLTDYSIELSQGYNVVGNSSPVDLDLSALKLVGETVSGSGANNICLLNASGVATGTYGWWTPDDGTGEDEGCWFDGDNWAVIEDTVVAGQGLYLYCEDAGLKLQFPKAL